MAGLSAHCTCYYVLPLPVLANSFSAPIQVYRPHHVRVPLRSGCVPVLIGLHSGNAVLLVQPVGRLTNYVGIAAIALSTLAFISTIALLNKFHEASEHTASEAVRSAFPCL